MKLKIGFTLAEVLITLGIIGIVTAMTIPGVITTYRKHSTAAALKRAVSTIIQAVRQSEQENGECENWDKTLDDETFIDTYLRSYMKISQTCTAITDCGYDKNYWVRMDGTRGSYSNPNNAGRVPFLTMDGILYAYSKIVSEDESLFNNKMVIIDINGSKRPNQFGYDVFFIYREEESDSFVPFGYDLTDQEIQDDCSKTGGGYYCAEWIHRNGWEIPSGYPW